MTVKEVEHLFQRFAEFDEATKDWFIEYEIWKSELSIDYIELDGRNIPAHRVTFNEWLAWMLQPKEIQIEQSDIEEFTPYEEVV